LISKFICIFFSAQSVHLLTHAMPNQAESFPSIICATYIKLEQKQNRDGTALNATHRVNFSILNPCSHIIMMPIACYQQVLRHCTLLYLIYTSKIYLQLIMCWRDWTNITKSYSNPDGIGEDLPCPGKSNIT